MPPTVSVGEPSVPMAAIDPVRMIFNVPPYAGWPAIGAVEVVLGAGADVAGAAEADGGLVPAEVADAAAVVVRLLVVGVGEDWLLQATIEIRLNTKITKINL